MAKSNEAAERLARVVAAVKAANVPDYVISGMTSRMPKGQWQVQQGGDKPSRELLVIAGLCTKNIAGAEGGFHALLMRDGGASLRELAYGYNAGPAHNHTLVGLSQGTANRPGPGLFYRETVGVGRWLMTITAKGEKHVMARLAAVTSSEAVQASKPAKASAKPKGEVKPKAKGKAPVTQTPTSEPATVTVTVAENQVALAEVQPVTVEPVTEVASPAELQGLADHFNS